MARSSSPERISLNGLLGAAEVRRIAADLGLHPSKAWGQNFVVDPGTVTHIARVAGVSAGDVVLEVGPGLGSLTLALLGTGADVVAVEVDPRLAERLPVTVAAHRPEAARRLRVVAADALRVGPELLGGPGGAPTALVANLPYNVAVPVLLRLLSGLPSVRTGLVMVQAEVAERLTARPGSRTYGVPTVKLAWFAAAARAGSVGPAVFWPVPRVDSGLVSFRRHERPPGDDELRARVFRLIDAAFAQRRKGLRACLAPLLGGPPSAEAALNRAGIDPLARGERLAVADFVRLAAQVPDPQEGDPVPG